MDDYFSFIDRIYLRNKMKNEIEHVELYRAIVLYEENHDSTFMQV